MDKMRIIKRICSNDCILNDQCDDGIMLTLSCAFIFDIFNSIGSQGPGHGSGSAASLLLDTSAGHASSLVTSSPLTARHPGGGQLSVQSWD